MGKYVLLLYILIISLFSHAYAVRVKNILNNVDNENLPDGTLPLSVSTVVTSMTNRRLALTDNVITVINPFVCVLSNNTYEVPIWFSRSSITNVYTDYIAVQIHLSNTSFTKYASVLVEPFDKLISWGSQDMIIRDTSTKDAWVTLKYPVFDNIDPFLVGNRSYIDLEFEIIPVNDTCIINASSTIVTIRIALFHSNDCPLAPNNDNLVTFDSYDILWIEDYLTSIPLQVTRSRWINNNNNNLPTIQLRLLANTGDYTLVPNGKRDFFRFGISIPQGRDGTSVIMLSLPNMLPSLMTNQPSYIFTGHMYPSRNYVGTRNISSSFRIHAYRKDANITTVPVPSQIKFLPNGSPNYFSIENPTNIQKCASVVYTAVSTSEGVNATSEIVFTINRLVSSVGFVGGVGVSVRFIPDVLPFNVSTNVTFFRFPIVPIPLFWNDGDYQSRTIRLFYNDNPWATAIPSNINISSVCGMLTLENPVGVVMSATSLSMNGLDLWKNRVRICIAATSVIANTITADALKMAQYGPNCIYPSITPTPSVTPTKSSSASPTSSVVPSSTPSTPFTHVYIAKLLNNVTTDYSFVIAPQLIRKSISATFRTSATVTVPPPLYSYLQNLALYNSSDYNFISASNMSMWYGKWKGLGKNQYPEFYDGNDIEISIVNNSIPSIRSAYFMDTGSELLLYPDIWIGTNNSTEENLVEIFRGIPNVGTTCFDFPKFTMDNIQISLCSSLISYQFIGLPVTSDFTAGSYSPLNPHIVTIYPDTKDGTFTFSGATRLPKGTLFPGFIYAVVPLWSSTTMEIAGYDSLRNLTGRLRRMVKHGYSKVAFIYVNQVPYNGTITSDRINGTSASFFTLSTSDWIDDTPSMLRPANERATDLKFELLFSHPLTIVPADNDSISIIKTNSFCSDSSIALSSSLIVSNYDMREAMYWYRTVHHVALMTNSTVHDVCSSVIQRAYQLWKPDAMENSHFSITFHALTNGSRITTYSPWDNPALSAYQASVYSSPYTWDGIPLEEMSNATSINTTLPCGYPDNDYSVAVYAFVQDSDGGVAVTSLLVSINTLDLAGMDAVNYVNNYLSAISNSVSTFNIVKSLRDITSIISRPDTRDPMIVQERTNTKENVINLISNVVNRFTTNSIDSEEPKINDGTADVVASSLRTITGDPMEITLNAGSVTLSTINNLMDSVTLSSPDSSKDISTLNILPPLISEAALGTVSNILAMDLFRRNNATNGTETGDISRYVQTTSPYHEATKNAITSISRAMLRDATPGIVPRSIVVTPTSNETINIVTGCVPSLALTVLRLSKDDTITSVDTPNAPCNQKGEAITNNPNIVFSVKDMIADSLESTNNFDVQILSYGSSPMSEDWSNFKQKLPSVIPSRRLSAKLEGPKGNKGNINDLLPSSGLDSNVLSMKLQYSDGSSVSVKNASVPIMIKLPLRTRNNITEREQSLNYIPPSFNVSCPSINDAILPSGSFLPVLRWYPNGISPAVLNNAKVLTYANTTYQVPIYWRTTGTKDRLPTVFGSKRTIRRDPLGQIIGYTTITVPVYSLSVDCGGMVGEQRFSCGSDPAIDDGPRNITFNCPPTQLQPTCAFWNDTVASWSDNGCTVVEATEEYILCSCTHLTEFGARFSALAQQQQDMFVLNDLFSDPDIITQYPYVFIVLGSIAGLSILLCLITTVLDVRGDARFYKLLILDEEIQTLRTIEEAKGNHFILDRLLDEKYARMNIESRIKFGEISGKHIDNSFENSSSKDANISYPFSIRSADSYTAGLYLKVVDAFDHKKVSLGHLRNEIQKADNSNTPTSIMVNKESDHHTIKPTRQASINNFLSRPSFRNFMNPETIEKVRNKIDKFGNVSQWSCVRLWKLRNFIVSSWITIIWTKHPYFSVFTRHDAHSTRTQRLLIICADLLTNLFATAFWFVWRNEEGENPDLPEMDVTELLVCAALATAMQVPINMLIENLMESAGEANFKFRYPVIHEELERRKRTQIRLSKLSGSLLNAEVQKYQSKLDRLLTKIRKQSGNDNIDRELDEILSHISPLMVHDEVQAKENSPKKKSVSQPNFNSIEKLLASPDDQFEYDWIDAPPSCQNYCGWLIWCCGRHPFQKKAYIDRQRELDVLRLNHVHESNRNRISKKVDELPKLEVKKVKEDNNVSVVTENPTFNITMKSESTYNDVNAVINVPKIDSSTVNGNGRQSGPRSKNLKLFRRYSKGTPPKNGIPSIDYSDKNVVVNPLLVAKLTDAVSDTEKGNSAHDNGDTIDEDDDAESNDDEYDDDDEIEIESSFVEELLSAGDAGERLYVVLKGVFDCLILTLTRLYSLCKPVSKPLSRDPDYHTDKIRDTVVQQKKLQRSHSQNGSFVKRSPKTNNSSHFVSNRLQCYGWCTKESLFAYIVTLSWMGFCLYYISLFGLYQGEEATYSFLQDWGISQAFASFGLTPISFLIGLLWMFIVWPVWLPYFIWIPNIGKFLASPETRAINASDGSTSLSGRMEHLTFLRAAGYASIMSPQTAVLAYGTSAAVAMAYSGIKSAINRISEKSSSRNNIISDENEKEISMERRSELIIRRYLLEQMLMVIKAKYSTTCSRS